MLITTFFTPQPSRELFNVTEPPQVTVKFLPVHKPTIEEKADPILYAKVRPFSCGLYFETPYLFPGGPRENGLGLGDFGHRCSKGRVCERTKKAKMTFICKAKFEELWEVKDSSFKRRFDANITSWVEMWTSSLNDIYGRSEYWCRYYLACWQREKIYFHYENFDPLFLSIQLRFLNNRLHTRTPHITDE